MSAPWVGQRWEYLEMHQCSHGGFALREALNIAGHEGWELVAMRWTEIGTELVFKRPKALPEGIPAL